MATVTKGDRTRARLLASAVQRFAADGYRRTSVSAVAREAGVTPAAVYAYFPGKDALFHAAVDTDAGALIERGRAAGAGADVRTRALRMLRALISHVDEHPLARRVLGGHEPDVVARLLDLPSLAALRTEVTEDFSHAQAGGTLRADVAPATLALGLESVVLALLMAQVQVGIDVDPARAAALVAVLEALLRAP